MKDTGDLFEMIPTLKLVTLKQKLEDKQEFIDEVCHKLNTGSFIDPQRIFFYYEIDRIQKMMEPIFKKLKLDVKITQAWVHIMTPGADHTTHNHELATGVLYLIAPKNSGNLYFDDFGITIPIEEDLFVLVPAKEKHSITKNKSKEIRITLAMAMENI